LAMGHGMITRPEQGEAAAAAILAAGYRKPRVISGVEDLYGLPDGALLISGNRYPGYAAAVWRVSDGMVTRVGRELDGVTPFRYFVDPLPVTVIHEP
jgi:hypothetical protein